MALETEMETYVRELPQLMAHEGKFVLIHGEEIAGFFDTYADAIHAGYDRYDLKPFLVKQVHAVEQALWFSRDVDVCHT